MSAPITGALLYSCDRQLYYGYNTVTGTVIIRLTHFPGGEGVISFEGFRAEDGVPIYLQIIKYLKQGVVSGAVADGDELPSRRVLSALLV